MRLTKRTTLRDYWHVVAAEWDGFAEQRAPADGGKVLGIADLIPEEARERRGTWRVTVEFEADSE
jgi:hypothetical protein